MGDKKFPWFWFYPMDFFSSQKVRVMTTAEVGAYFTMLCYAWMNEPPAYLPNDEEHLRELCRMSTEEWATARKHIMACWNPTADGQLVYNPRLLKVRQEAEEFSARQCSRIAKRWKHVVDTEPIPDDTNALGITEPIPDDTRSHSHPHSESSRTPLPPLRRGDGQAMSSAEQEVIEAWNGLGKPFSKVQHLGNGTRRSYLKARLLDPWWREHWREALAKMATIPGMRGQNHRGSPVDFLFFVRADSVAKILEGKYDTWGQKAAAQDDDSWMYAGLKPKGDK